MSSDRRRIDLLEWAYDQAERVRAHRRDPEARLQAAQSAVLRYLLAQKRANRPAAVLSELIGTQDAMFEKTQLTKPEIDEAAVELAEAGLIEGVGSWGGGDLIRPRITASGIECVKRFGANMTDYERNLHRSPSPAINIGTFHNYGNAAVGLSGATMTQNDIAGLGRFASTLLDALPSVSVQEHMRDELKQILAEIKSTQSGAAAEPVANGPFQRLASWFGQVGTEVTAGLLLVIAQHAMNA